jgi:membrane fusion protein (multidrug efflux system)
MKMSQLMSKRLVLSLFLVGALLCGFFGYATLFAQKVTMTSSSTSGKTTTTGVVRAVQGVDVTTESAGIVKKILFTSGTDVTEGTVIVELTSDAEFANLRSLEAKSELAKNVYLRNKKQYEIQGVSKADLLADLSDLKSKQADVAEQRAIAEKKIIRAPFSGRLGISKVNLGQYIEEGGKIVSLQTLDPIYIDFSVPQSMLPHITVNQRISFTTDACPNITFEGKITCISPIVDATTKTLQIEATISNSGHKLLPGVSGIVEVRNLEVINSK